MPSVGAAAASQRGGDDFLTGFVEFEGAIGDCGIKDHRSVADLEPGAGFHRPEEFDGDSADVIAFALVSAKLAAAAVGP